jgi:hypothetical protein
VRRLVLAARPALVRRLVMFLSDALYFMLAL